MELWLQPPEKLHKSMKLNQTATHKYDYAAPEHMLNANNLRAMKAYATLYPNDALTPLSNGVSIKSKINQYQPGIDDFVKSISTELGAFIKLNLEEIKAKFASLDPESKLFKQIDEKIDEKFLLKQLSNQLAVIISKSFKYAKTEQSTYDTPNQIFINYAQQFINSNNIKNKYIDVISGKNENTLDMHPTYKKEFYDKYNEFTKR